MVSLITTGTESPSELFCLSLQHTQWSGSLPNTHSGQTHFPTQPWLAEVHGAGHISVRAQSTKNDLQLQRNTKHLVRKRRTVRRRHRRLTAWLHGGSQLLVIPGTETSSLLSCRHFFTSTLEELLVEVADYGLSFWLENQVAWREMWDELFVKTQANGFLAFIHHKVGKEKLRQ